MPLMRQFLSYAFLGASAGIIMTAAALSLLPASTPAATAATASVPLVQGVASIGSGNVQSVIETTSQHYARIWFKRAGSWI